MPARALEIVQELRAHRRLGSELVETLYLPPRAPRFGEAAPALPPGLVSALAARGVGRLWSHQAAGLTAARRGENALVTTPTASGKSLIFHLPVLEEAIQGGPGRALFLFPLKALGQDQKGKFDALASAAGLGEAARCEIYDGDTPRRQRQRIREDPPRVVISNPDMVHLGLLAYPAAWAPLLRDLRWIVLDELHTYRGIFGSHFHHVLSRLLRLCATQGAEPVLIASSATAANAGGFAEALTGRPFRWIAESGAPRAGRHLLLCRPGASPYTTALHLTVQLLEAGLKTIVFTKARRITELLYSWLARQAPRLAPRVASYRSGFLPEERRRIEADLFSGRLDGVISTSALEMGIDVGGLDACVLVGYPGSVMATWQRSGRVGRGDRESLTALVALPDALDQYLLDHPQELVGRPCEELVVDPGNGPVSRAHLVCAAAELPLDPERDRRYLEAHRPAVRELLGSGELLESADGRVLYAAARRPHRRVNLRGIGETYAILRAGSGELIGTADGVGVFLECHPGAIYLHGGRQFLVRELDLAGRKVWAEPAAVDYYTAPLTEKDTEILELLRERKEGILEAGLGRLRVTERVVGFERRRIGGQEPIDQWPIELPPQRFETVGLWWRAPAAVEEALRRRGEHFLGSLHAAEHAAISLFPMVALCDRGDVGGVSVSLHRQLRTGGVFLYDGHPGGVGLAARVFEDLGGLFRRILDLLDRCPCDGGCPGCVQSPKCGNGNRPLDKGGAARLLRLLSGLEEPAPAPAPPRLQIAATVAAPAPPPGVPGRSPEAGEGRGTLLFDLETQRSAEEVGGWGNAHRMRLAVAALWHLEEGRLEVFREDQVGQLLEALEGAGLVVGFNVERFDYRVLSGYTGIDYRRRLPTLDLMEDIRRRLGFRLGLDHLAQETLGAGKAADGLQSLAWFREGRLDLVEAYCRRDVEILRDLYLFGRRMGYLVYRDRRDRRLRLPVAW